MTLQERRQREAALTFRIRSARDQMTRALVAMDEKAALAYQIDINNLQREIRLLVPRQPETGEDGQLARLPRAFVGRTGRINRLGAR
jgi:hypothetical protein